MNRLFEAFVKFIYGKSRAWRAMMTALSALIVFSTTYALILPAITLDSNRVYDEPGIELDDNYFEDVNYGENPSDAQGLVFEDTGDIYFDGNEPDVYIEDADNGYFGDTYFEDEADTYFENGDAGLFVDDENAFLAEDNEADLFGDVLFDDEAGLLPDPEAADSMAVIVEDMIDVDSIVPEAEEPADIFVDDEDEAEYVEEDAENVEAEETAAEADDAEIVADDAENDADNVEVSEAEDAEATDEAESEFADAADTEITASVVEEAEAVYEFMAANAAEMTEAEDAEASEADEAAEMTETVASDAEEIESVESQIEEVVDAEEVVSEDEAESVSSEVEEVMDAEEAVPADEVESVSSEVEEVMDAAESVSSEVEEVMDVAESVSSEVEEVMDAADSTLSEVEDMIDSTDSTTSEVEDVVAFEEATWSDAESAAESVPSYANGVEDIEEVYPAVDFYRATPYVSVKVHADEGAFPAGTTMTVEDVEDEETITAITEAAEETEAKVRKLHAVNITFLNVDGQEIEPLIPISVKIRSEQIAENEKAMVVHVDDDGNATALSDVEVEAKRNSAVAEVTKEGTGEGNTVPDEAGLPDSFPEDVAGGVDFEAEEFSVYAIVYTVDFEYSVNGKMYQFSLPGGGFVSFTDLVEVLGIVGDANSDGNGDENGSIITENAEDNAANEGAEENGVNSNTNTSPTLSEVKVSEAARKFVADVASVEFSSPELVDVSKVDAETTVGQIKESRGLECEYSADLTEEQIAEINTKTVGAGDWALISLKAFDTEEYLTVTMKTGEVFKINVTDDQENPLGLDGKSFAITASKNNNYYYLANDSSSSNGNCLKAYTFNPNGGGTPQGSTWTFEWTGEGKKYLIHDNQNRYILIENDKVSLTNRDTALANPITVVSREGKYSFVNEKNNQALNIYGSSGFGRWPYAESNSDFLMTLQNPSNLKKPGTITTADTSGLLQINLFDYGPEDQLDKEANNNTNPYSGGINSGHTLKFFSYGKNVGTGINDFTGQGNGPHTGIVADQLSGDYPVLASNPSESLAYLFGGESNNYVTSYTGLNHLFTKDENGYYHYDSDQNYAYLDGSNFKVYSKTFPEEGADKQYFGVGFFPFNDYDEYYNCIHGKDGFERWDPHSNGTNPKKNGHYNHHFGMSLKGNFIMPPGGQYNGKDVTFQFSGDDDMWVYVDGVLIMDIGGVHNPVHGEINFTTGEVTVHGAAQENFKEKYKRITGNDWDDSDFSNHDFRVFYMERGGMYSNLEVTFNLPMTPETETNNFQFDKISSENESLKLSGAEFSLFNDPACGDPFTLASVPVKATSDKNGVVSFKNIPHGTYYMKETVYPEGYQAKTPEEIFTVVVDASGGTITSSSGDSISQVTNKPKKIDVEVEKVWSNGIVPSGAEIEIVLGRYKLVEDPNAPGTATLVIKDSYTGLPSGSNYHVTYTITGPDGYSNTITKSYTDSSKQIEESVEVPATVAGSQYTVTKQVQNISYHNINNQNQTVNVTVTKNGTGQTQFNQSTFTRNAYRVRIYAVNSTDPNNLYSENYYPAGSNLSLRIDHKNYNWGFFSFTVSSNTGWNSDTYTSDSQQQFTSNLNQDTDLILHCHSDVSNWTKGHDWIKDPYITGANPVRAASAGRMMMSMRRGASAQSMSQTASAPTLPDPPQNTLYVLDEEYAANPDKITLSGGTWTGKAEDLDAYNEYGPYVYYIASVNESGMPEGTQITISDEVSMDGAAQILTVTNTVPTGDLQITKNILKNGTTDASATGTFYYAIFDEEYNPSANSAQAPIRTGSIVVSSNGTQTVTETDLICGTYYVYELNGKNGTPIVSGNDGSVQVIGGICYTVTGSGSTANVGSNAGTAVLTNNQETVDITATKQWQDKNGTVLTGTNIPANANVTFTLLADGTATSHTVEVNGVDDAAGGVTPATADYEGANWTAYFTGLPKYTNAGTLINYTVQETGTWDGYVVDGNATVSSGGTIINKQQTVEINILKVDKSDGTTPLTGAKFVLKRYKEGYHEVQETWPEQTVSSEEGKKGTLIINGLTVGYYELEETESPAGYIRTSAFPRFEVAVNSTTKELEVIFTDNTGGMVSYDPTNNVFTVRNEPGAALPSTGGFGTKPFTIGGMMLVLMSLMLYCIGGKRRTLAEEFSLGAGGSAGKKGGDPRL